MFIVRLSDMFRELWPLRALRSVAPRRPAPLCPAGCLALACAVCAVSRALWCVVERDHLCLWRLRSGARGSPQRRAQAQQAPGWDFSGTHTHHTHSPRHCLQFCGARVRLRRGWARIAGRVSLGVPALSRRSHGHGHGHAACASRAARSRTTTRFHSAWVARGSHS